MSSPKNAAAFLEAAKASPFVVKEIPYRTAAPHEVIIQTKAVAANPIDLKLQYDSFMPLQYPTVLGFDLSGEVVDVGSDVKNLRKGDRVAAAAGGTFSSSYGGSAFQRYVNSPSNMLIPIPDNVSYEEGTVLPVGVLTAACALFMKDNLGLQLPSFDSKPNGKVVFIWGGSSSVGCNAIQFAKAAGYEVAVTASARNAELCKALGADYVFDYASATVVDDVAADLKGKDIVGGYDTISHDTLKSTVQVIEKTAGKAKVVSTHPGAEAFSTPDVPVVGINGFTFIGDESAPFVLREFVPKSLTAKTFSAKPEPVVVGKGLESIQAAVDKLKGPVSAQKFVVTL